MRWPECENSIYSRSLCGRWMDIDFKGEMWLQKRDAKYWLREQIQASKLFAACCGVNAAENIEFLLYRGNRRRTPAASQTKTKVLSRSRVPGEKKRRSSPGACIHFFLSPNENIRGCFSYTRACDGAGGNFLSHYGAIYFKRGAVPRARISSLIFTQRPTSITYITGGRGERPGVSGTQPPRIIPSVHRKKMIHFGRCHFP